MALSDTFSVRDLMPYVLESDESYIYAHRNAMSTFLIKRKAMLRNKATLEPLYDSDERGENPCNEALRKNLQTLQRLFFLEENGLKRMAFKEEESEKALTERITKLQDILSRDGETSVLNPTGEEIDTLARSYEIPSQLGFDKETGQPEKCINIERLGATCIEELRINDLADRILAGTKTNIHEAIDYLSEILQAAKVRGGIKVYPQMPARQALLDRMHGVAERGIKEVGFALDSRGFMNLHWLDKRVADIEKALEEGTMPPVTPYVEKLSNEEIQARESISNLIEFFPVIKSQSIYPRLSLFIKSVKAYESQGGTDLKAVLVEAYEGSFVALDAAGKRAYPFRPEHGRAGVVEDLSSILANNIGWVDDTKLNEKNKGPSIFIDKTRKCPKEGPDREYLSLLLQPSCPARPAGPTNARNSDSPQMNPT